MCKQYLYIGMTVQKALSQKYILTHVPPNLPLSMRPTLTPNSAALLAEAMPPEPPPRTKKSNFLIPVGAILLAIDVNPRMNFIHTHCCLYPSTIGFWPLFLFTQPNGIAQSSWRHYREIQASKRPRVGICYLKFLYLPFKLKGYGINDIFTSRMPKGSFL